MYFVAALQFSQALTHLDTAQQQVEAHLKSHADMHKQVGVGKGGKEVVRESSQMGEGGVVKKSNKNGQMVKGELSNGSRGRCQMGQGEEVKGSNASGEMGKGEW